jgi:hypothetical protein
MRTTQFLASVRDQIRRDGIDGLRDASYRLYRVGWGRVSALDRSGRHVYDEDWDVLIVLDACRADLLAEVAPEFEFLPAPGSARSVASTSAEWLGKTFADDRRAETRRTAYVTGNPFSDQLCDPASFARLDEVWRYGWDDELGTVPAEPITDRAIDAWRSGAADRMIVHYMQPHFPSVPTPDPAFASGIELDAVGAHWESVWDGLRRGRLDRDAVWSAYRDNLRYVLGQVEVLVNSIDADRVAITADHGNSFGSWGLYGHPRAPIRAIREVPWLVTTARDSGDYEPREWIHGEAGESDSASDTESARPGRDDPDERVESMLRNLGYM